MRTPQKKKRRVELSMDKDKKNGQDFSGAEAAIRNLVASIPGVQKLIDTVPGADTTVKSIVSGIPGAASLFDKVSSPQRNLNLNASKLTSTTKYNFRVERNVGGISGLHIAYVSVYSKQKTHGNTHTHSHTKQIRRLHRGSGTKTLSSSELISLDRRTSSTIRCTTYRSTFISRRSSSCHQRCERQWIVSRFHYSRLLFQLDIHTRCILCSTSRLSDARTLSGQLDASSSERAGVMLRARAEGDEEPGLGSFVKFNQHSVPQRADIRRHFKRIRLF